MHGLGSANGALLSCCRKMSKWTKEFISFLVQVAAAVKSSIFEKFTTFQYQKDKGFAFKDFILNCVQKVTDPSEGEDEKVSGDSESLATVLTTPQPE